MLQSLIALSQSDTSIVIAAITSLPLLLGVLLPLRKNNKERRETALNIQDQLEVINKKIETNNGKTIGQHIEDITQAIEKIWVKLDTAGPARLSALIDLASDGILIGDTDGRVTYANARACEIIGMEMTEILKDGWIDAIHPDDRDRVFRESRAYIEENRAFDMTYRILYKNGDINTIRGRGRAVYSHEGIIIGYMGVISQL